MKNPLKIFQKSFSVRITLFFALLMIVSIGLQTFIFVRMEANSLRDSFIENKREYAEFIAMNFKTAEEAGNVAHQSELLQKAAETKDVLYVRIVRAVGEIYLSSDPREQGENAGNDSAVYAAGSLIREKVFQGEKIREAVFPVSAGDTVQLGFSLASVNRSIVSMAFSRWIFGLAVFAAAIIFFYFLASRAAKNIKILKMAADKVGKGDWKVKVDIKSADELGELALSFNRMTDDLRGTAEKLREYGESMERKVGEKTAILNAKTEDLEELNRNLADSQNALLNLMEDVEKSKKEAEEENFRRLAIMESMKEGLVVVDDENKVISVNPVAEKIFSVKEKDLLSQDVDAKFNNRQIEEALKSGGKAENIFEINVDSEEGKVFKAIISPVVSASGEIIGKVMVMQNLTHEKEIEEMRKRFVSVTAHELRTPLGAMRWSIELLQGGDMGKMNDGQKDLIGKIYDSVNRLLSIVSDLLEVSRIDEERFKTEKRPHQLEDCVDTVAGDLAVKIREKNQRLVWERPKIPLPKVMIDPNRIIQVLLNLVGNSAKFTPEGKKIEVRVEEVAEIAPPGVIAAPPAEQQGRKYLRCAVADEGVGIPQAEQKKIFDRFFRASNVQELQIEGTGLGLSIVKSIIEKHGGAIWFESAEGKGTTFYFTLPIIGKKNAEEIQEG